MIALLLALQATVTEALPADVSAAAAQTVAQASHGGINYLELMLKASIPVKLIVHPQPGLFGAAAAFASEHA